MKKLISLIMALVLLLALAVPVMAADAESATIDTGRTASLDIYKYDLTRAEADGVWDASSYTSTGIYDSTVNSILGDTSFTNNSGTNNTAYGYAVKGVKFSYLKVADICTYSMEESDGTFKDMVLYGMTASSQTEAFLSCLGLSYANAYYAGRLSSTSNMYYFVSDVLIDALADALSSNATATKNALEEYIAANGGTVLPETDEYGHTSADGLPLGLYLLVESYVPDMVTSTCSPCLVSLPMTTIDGDEWNYNVTVYPKNETGMPTLEKTVRESSADTGHNDGSAADITDGYAHTATASDGDVVEYQVISTLPSITSEASYLTCYTFEDTLSKGITYNVVIEFFKDSDCTDRIVTWTQTDSVKKFSVAYSAGEYGESVMTIAMTAAGLKEINTASGVYNDASLYTGYSDCTMRITYAATVNSDATVVYGDTGNPNHVQLTWKRTSTTYYDVLDDDCHIYTYGIDLTKQFSDDAGNFQNVKFLFHNDTDGYYVQAELHNDGVYYVTGHAEQEADATVFVPTDEGKITVKGLEDDDYTLTEAETDSGYTLLKDDIEIIIRTKEGDVCQVCHEAQNTAVAAVNGTEASLDSDNGSVNALVPLIVVNTKGFTLPQTGSNGTWMYAAAGVAVMALAAAVLLLLCKSKRGKRAK